MKLTITQLGQVKDIQTQYGMKQKSSIKAKEYNDNWLGYWVGKNTNWKVGDVIEVESVNPREYQGKTYYDIKLPKVNDMAKVEMVALQSEVKNMRVEMNRAFRQIIDHLSGKNRLGMTDEGKPVPFQNTSTTEKGIQH